MKSNRFWILLFAFIGAVCLAAAVLLQLPGKRGVSIEIYQQGALLHTLPLDTPARLTIDAPNGGSNTVWVENGAVCVSHASCPDQVCVNQGWVDSGAVPIVCLPNQLVIQIKGGEQTVDTAVG
ncbi:MAG: NusG domain II-containing protein [Oscillospiraceae bacterium]|nr:NusG domain II-containing protein [Oscillospiraceae bacterium]